jgi:hypothetical protein
MIVLYSSCLKDYDRDWHIYHDETPQVWAFPRLWDREGSARQVVPTEGVHPSRRDRATSRLFVP